MRVIAPPRTETPPPPGFGHAGLETIQGLTTEFAEALFAGDVRRALVHAGTDAAVQAALERSVEETIEVLATFRMNSSSFRSYRRGSDDARTEVVFRRQGDDRFARLEIRWRRQGDEWRLEALSALSVE